MSNNRESVFIDEETAELIEKKYVHDVYDEIFEHFDQTRYKCWPKVSEFLSQFRLGQVVIDIGCGNGKYFKSNSEFLHFGCDLNENLLKISSKKGIAALKADCTQLPFRDEIADGCVCIAVLHHLATQERRIKALKEISRVLIKNGKALIYVWAKNQQNSNYIHKGRQSLPCSNATVQIKPEVTMTVHRNRTEFTDVDVLVPWKLKNHETNQIFLRYYHVFEIDELKRLCSSIENIEILQEYYDQGNVCIIFQKSC